MKVKVVSGVRLAFGALGKNTYERHGDPITRVMRVLHSQSQQASDPIPKHIAATLHRDRRGWGGGHVRGCGCRWSVEVWLLDVEENRCGQDFECWSCGESSYFEG